jgi:ectoine hydroxylase-related dioxygenase (phytanoyl-CoA dioxygenase family)
MPTTSTHSEPRAPRADEIPRFGAAVSAAILAEALRTHGCAIVERYMVQATARARLELEPYLSRVPHSLGSFTGKRTRRTLRLIVKSPAVREMIDDDLIQDACARLFRGEAYHHQLHATEAVCIDPGEAAQSLHRDDGTYPFRHPCPPSVVNTIWALDDFTRDNGATRVIPGSHRWNDQRRALENETTPAIMPSGSVLLIDGALVHGGGENRSSRSRTALLLGYSLGWLRPAENPQLAVPPAQAKHLSKRLQDLLGYKTHGYLGNFEGTQPSAAWRDPLPDVLAAEDLYGPELEALAVRRR